MATVVIPFAGAEGKTRLHSSTRIRRALAHAMFCDVLAACVVVGDTRVVTPDEEGANAARGGGAAVLSEHVGGAGAGAAGPGVVSAPRGGQAAAVQAGLKGVESGAILIVNADVPCAVPHDLRS